MKNRRYCKYPEIIALKLMVGFLLVIMNCIVYSQPKTIIFEEEKPIMKENLKKVLIHYMGWYGDTIADNYEIKRHWKHGHANTPQIGYYDSKNQSLILYHILLSWSCGIDGVIINVKDQYDDICMKTMIKTIKRIRKTDSINFKYEFGISYDDQGFDLAYPYDTTLIKLNYLRDSVLPELPCYIKYENRPAIFVFDYPEKFLTAEALRGVINEVFDSQKPILIWNSFDDKENSEKYVDAFYPWVQPGRNGWNDNGQNWGKDYLDWYYNKVNEINTENKYVFTCGGVWPGFDDRKNISWGGNRLMSRMNGEVYDSTWAYILNYKGLLPLNWVVIETWNDWNEGTEIEPGIEDGYSYLIKTVRNINKFKGTDTDEDIYKFKVARKIYEASLLIERGLPDTDKYNPVLEESIKLFLQKEFNNAENTANTIIKANVNLK